jgi:molybdenum cofactor biosynthesis protein A
MPEAGIKYKPRKALMTYEELLRLVKLLAPLGVEKIRITGGEPFLRKDLMDFIRKIRDVEGIQHIHITTNGTQSAKLIHQFREAGISSVNLSLDSLDEKRFFEITRRNELKNVLKSLDLLLEQEIPTKINAVVMKDHNTQDILPMVEFGKNSPVDVRFIEEMPFNGSGSNYQKLEWDYQRMLEHIREHYPDIQKIRDPAHSTSFNYEIPGHLGRIGFIPAYTRLFCGSCNRIRLTPIGTLKTCLYDDGVLNIRDLMRKGLSDEALLGELKKAFSNRAKDGFEAENRRKSGDVSESMATIGG